MPRRRRAERGPGRVRSATTVTWGSPEKGPNVPPPKSTTKIRVSRGVPLRATPATRVRRSVLVPLRGPPTTATWPRAPVRSRVRVSRLCARGRSTMPIGTWRGPVVREHAEVSPRCGSARRSGSRPPSVSGASIGGSHMRWAAGPRPAIAPTARSRNEASAVDVPGSHARCGETPPAPRCRAGPPTSR